VCFHTDDGGYGNWESGGKQPCPGPAPRWTSTEDEAAIIHPPSCRMITMYLGCCMSCTPLRKPQIKMITINTTQYNNITYIIHQPIQAVPIQHLLWPAVRVLKPPRSQHQTAYSNSSQQYLYNICCVVVTGRQGTQTPPIITSNCILTYSSQQYLYNICCVVVTGRQGTQTPPLTTSNCILPLCNSNYWTLTLSNHYNISPTTSIRRHQDKHTTKWTVRGRQGHPYQSLFHHP
jgi:hypothetical protein